MLNELGEVRDADYTYKDDLEEWNIHSIRKGNYPCAFACGALWFFVVRGYPLLRH
jgi:hypothetical protein